MKKNKLTALFFLFAGIISAQTATSVQNGNWTNPMTWSCTCVPTPGYTVIINNTVTLNTSFGYTTGSITVNIGGTLVDDPTGRDLWLNGGTFTNNGTTDIRNFLIQAGTFSNSGTITANAIANYVVFTNSGTFLNVDSIYNSSSITNNGSFSGIDSITNAGIFLNNGSSVFNQFTNTGQYVNNNNLSFTDITNTGTLSNADTILCTHSVWNTGLITNMLSSYFNITKSILNQDPVAHDAVISNNGRMNVQDSWYNFDSITGSGSFIVQDTSYNSGFMKNNFDFCDLTPPNSAPYVDINLGTISSAITWCINTGIADQQEEEIIAFPNPANDIIMISGNLPEHFNIMIYSMDGKLILESKDNRKVDVSNLLPGIYLTQIKAENKNIFIKTEIVR